MISIGGCLDVLLEQAWTSHLIVNALWVEAWEVYLNIAVADC